MELTVWGSQCRSLQSRATDVVSSQPLPWDLGVYSLAVYVLGDYNLGLLIMDATSHSPGTGSLQSWNLQSGSLQSRAPDVGFRQPLTWDWESIVWQFTVWKI